MRDTVLSKNHQSFIKNNYLKLSGSSIATMFGVSKNIIYRFMRKNGLVVSADIKNNFRLNAINSRIENTIHKEDKIIIQEYLTTPLKSLAKKINRSDTYVRGRLKRLGLIIPSEIIEKRKLDSRKKKRDIPKNKGLKQVDYMSPEAIEKVKNTQFKKGCIPHNALGIKDGEIRVRYAHKHRGTPPYKWIRISLGKWKMYHVHLWEQIHGKVPNGSIVVFKDKDTMNTAIDNLECITMEENMVRNSIHRYPEELKRTIQALSSINRKIKKYEKQD